MAGVVGHIEALRSREDLGDWVVVWGMTYDSLIISRGRERDNALAGPLQGSAAEVHEIGDCSSVGDIQKAVSSANEVARAI